MPFKFENNVWQYQPDFLKYRFNIPYFSQHYQGLRCKVRTANLREIYNRYASTSWHEELDLWDKVWRSFFTYAYFVSTNFETFKEYKFAKYLSEADLKDLESSFRYFHDKLEHYDNCLSEDYSSYTNNRNSYENVRDIIKDHNREIWKWYKLPGYVKPIKQYAAERHEEERRIRFTNTTNIPMRRFGVIEEKYIFPKPLEPIQYYYGRYIVPGHKGHPGFHWHQEFSDYIY